MTAGIIHSRLFLGRVSLHLKQADFAVGPEMLHRLLGYSQVYIAFYNLSFTHINAGMGEPAVSTPGITPKRISPGSKSWKLIMLP